jgi:tetratricopeptide (TPR) repeat protein
VNIGHPFSQGTVDSNEIWVDFEAKSGARVIARNGALANPDESGEVDPWSHFINVLMLDRKGNRINRRNPQDIFTPLYNKQIPPGAASVVHYQLDVPKDVTGPIELKARVRYRKFDYEYMKLVHKDKPVPKLPIVDICEDKVTLPIEGTAASVPEQKSPIKPPWQRWNDYGIGCFIEGGAAPTGLSEKRGEMKQAREAFQRLIASGEKDALPHGCLNLARVLIDDNSPTSLDEAAELLNKAGEAGAPWWTVAWFKAMVTSLNATKPEQLDAAIKLLDTILDPANQPTDRGFDFRRDIIVLNQLGRTLFKRSQLELDHPQAEERYLLRAVEAYEKVLAIESEDVETHFGLYQCYDRLGRGLSENLTSSRPAAAALQALGDELADPAKRREAALTLMRDLPPFLDPTRPLASSDKPPKLYPKLPTVKLLIPKAREAYQAESDAETRRALAQVLSSLHSAANLIYKPDDQARAETTRKYRATHPAANYAAEAVVIYPTTPAQVETLLKRLKRN